MYLTRSALDDRGPRLGGSRESQHPRHGLSNNDPILLEVEDEANATPAITTPRSTLASHTRKIRPDSRDDASITLARGTNRESHQNSSLLTTSLSDSEEGANNGHPMNTSTADVAISAPPHATLLSELSRRRNLAEKLLGTGYPPPMYPDLPNFGGPVMIKDRNGDIPPIYIPYEMMPEDFTPPPDVQPPSHDREQEPGPEAFEMQESDLEEDSVPEEIHATGQPNAVQPENSRMFSARTTSGSGGGSPERIEIDDDLDVDEDDLNVRPAFRASQLKRKKKAPAAPSDVFPMRRVHATRKSPDSARVVAGKATDTDTGTGTGRGRGRGTEALRIDAHSRYQGKDVLSTTPVHQSIEATEPPDRPSVGTGPHLAATAALIRDDRTISASPAAIRTTASQNQKGPTSGPSDTPSFNLLTLNRQAMEAERLARLKRKREAEGDKTVADEVSNRGRVLARSDREKSKTVSLSPPPLRRARLGAGAPGTSLHQSECVAGIVNTKVTTATTAKETPASQQTRGSTTTSSNAMYFPRGKVFQTYIEGFPAANTITLPQLIGRKESLTGCLLSSFIWDFDWLLPHFSTNKTKFQLVMHAKSAAQREALLEDFRGISNVRLCFPPMDSIINCMHSKLMLLFYDATDMDMAMAMSMPSATISSTSWLAGPRCRIVVPTANLTGSDWGVGGVMENTVFLIDLPVKSDSAATTTDATPGGDETGFQMSLVAFLRAQTVPEDIIRKLEHFDFRQTAEYGFVHTIGGVHGGEQWHMTGLGGLGRRVAEMGLASSNPPEINFVTSSVGSLNDEFMDAMYTAAQGDANELTAERNRDPESSRRQLGATKASINPTRGLTEATVTDRPEWRQNFRFFFPSDDTVTASIGGPGAAETICFSDKWWQSARFPRQNMRDCISVRRGCLMHNKVGRHLERAPTHGH